MGPAETSAVPARFGLAAGLDLSVRRWSDDGVVHDAASNGTFWLTGDALGLLDALKSSGVATVAELSSAIGVSADRAASLLQDMKRRGLVCAC